MYQCRGRGVNRAALPCPHRGTVCPDAQAGEFRHAAGTGPRQTAPPGPHGDTTQKNFPRPCPLRACGAGGFVGVEGGDAGQIIPVAILKDGLARAADQIQKISQVVQGIEAKGQQLLTGEEVTQIGAGKGAAGVAAAAGVQGAVVFGVLTAFDVDLAVRGVERAGGPSG